MAQKFVWGARSKAGMRGLHPDLVKLLNRYIQIARVDTTIIEGVRSDEQCYINFGKGRTAAQCVAAGCPAKYARPAEAKVTWLKNPLNSNHRKKADGYGYAVDQYPYPVSLVFGRPSKEWMPLFKTMNEDMMQAAKEVGVKIRWGADWDNDGIPWEKGESDNPHWELVR